MTALEEQILKLPKLQKISIMERIWEDLSQNPEQFEIPEWHKGELERAEKGLAEGKEKFEDWDEVKKRLLANSMTADSNTVDWFFSGWKSAEIEPPVSK